ncbi:RND family efflux transporter MFP subunit [Rhodoligotrophos appendicifer]|uniref:efflux RND transporter periplasmic adaptor subunit n=1 Tax=Rhodoligotrophos appendicifer TaxID=987056 RepID=UPI00118537AF|nr:HlyD family secretion protein [Rhodoligotrophos appendicifer]
MAVGNQMVRVAVTLIMTMGALVIAWKLWDFYMYEPWTRDARVRATILNLAPDVPGLISTLNVIDNQRVRKGDVVFVIEPDRFQAALAEAQALVENKKASLRLASDNAARDEQVAKSDAGAISQVQVETSRATAAVAAAELDQAQAALKTAQINLERSTVRSPVNGFITNLTASVGDYATTGTPVMAIIDSDSYYVYAYFMETKLPAIRDGAAAEVLLMAGGIKLAGRVQGVSRGIAEAGVDQVGLLANVDPNFTWVRLAQRVPVRISLENLPPDLRLVAGLTATVTVKND